MARYTLIVTIVDKMMKTIPNRERLIVVVDASRSKVSMEALDWALKNVVRPRDNILVLAVLYDNFSFPINKKTPTSVCFPFKFLMGIGERLEFGGQGQVNLRELEEEFEEKRALYQSNLLPFYKQCKKLEVKLDVKLAAGFSAGKLTVEEAQNSNTRWIVLDSPFKKDRIYIYGHVSCNVAIFKGKDVATLMTSKDYSKRNWEASDIHQHRCTTEYQERELSSAHHQIPSQSPCWFPLSWRSEFPRCFSRDEIEVMTKGFSVENVIKDDDCMQVFQGLLQEIPVLVKCFKESNKTFWSTLKILNTIRHRNIATLVGYCCSDDLKIMIFDFPCKGDDLAHKLGWRSRWCIAQEIGSSLRYLHEECVEGPIVHNSVCSSHVVISHGCSAMLSHLTTAQWIKDEETCNENFLAECSNQGEDKNFCIDIHDYGILLLELITGKNVWQGEGNTLIDWGLPLLENGLLCQLMDSRLKETDGAWMVHHMAHAALHCLKLDSTHNLSISEAIGLVRGDTRGTCNHWKFEKHAGDCSCPKSD
ncbi:probable receptor-like serine/threonine-protein kinase At5g57670 [Humulus lupulus]|uniref:probable receptor-like serine/threonine-protein kinase At5g57670 n=1 Tax=Humulus lupulus TaxID=3486 RepID=UPI002B40CBBC|nr:probable receptor-like serine/threonine-protein kinase At5g57670 [Humulus lupulus]